MKLNISLPYKHFLVLKKTQKVTSIQNLTNLTKIPEKARGARPEKDDEPIPFVAPF
jgi:hypothetical protein